MIIDRDKHNKYVVGWKPNYTVPTNQGSSSGTNVTIVYGGGGSGSSTPVSSEAFSYYKVSDGENAITQEAKVQKDVANLSIIGDEGIKVELITDPTIFEASFTSTGTNTGVYKISYGKVTTVVEEPGTQAEEPTEPEVVTTFPMTITYVSGEKIKAEQFDTLRLLNNTEEVATYPSSGLTIEGDADGILSISLEVYKEVQSVDEEGNPVQDAEGNPVMEKQGLYFNRILLTTQLEDQPSTQAEGDSTEEEPQQPTYESLLSFDVVVNIDTVVKLSVTAVSDLWKLDDNGNIYTEYNAYSLKELSAYGLGEGESGEGVGFLHELGDVSIPDPNAIPDNAILQYNIETGKWEAVELELPEDSATREWVEQKFKDLINGAPADLDTLGEIAIAIQELQQLLDWFSFVDGRIRANYNFWGVGEVSAYGPASGSDPGTGGGAGYLHELGDVTINNDTLTDGQIIVWDEDNQMWVNTDFPGLDEDALALYLTQNKYATQEWVNGQLDSINNKLEEFQTTIDMINDMFEWDNGKIKAKATLYSVGEISAYGAGEGSSGTGGYLHELDDVLLTSLQDDQLLMYDATIEKWVNVDKDEVGLNETQLAQYLTEHGYAIMSNVVPITRRIIAGDGLQGGGPLSSDVTLSMAPLTASDIPGLDWSKIISGKPTTLAGYGITDGVNAVSVTGTGNAVTTASISGHTLTLTKASSFALITGTNATGTWPISITGNAATANKWTTARTITLAGAVIGSTSIDGSGNVTITTTYTTDNISALDGRYVNVTGDIMTGNLILPTLQANTSIILGSVKLEYDSASNALKISNVNTQQVINLYATGEISAYGYNSGSAGGGASALDDLDDVTLSNLQNGQALVYNSSTGQWVNATIQAGGIDESALAQYLTNNQYLTMPTGDGRYFRKNAGSVINGYDMNDCNVSGMYFVSSNSASGIDNYPASYGYAILANMVLANGRGMQILMPDGDFPTYMRQSWNTNAWRGWRALLDSLTYTNYTVTKTGGGASGTWGISISGSSVRITSTIYNSGSLASLTTAGCLYHAAGGNTVTDKPSGVDAFGLFTMQTASGWQGQILMSSNTATGLYWRTSNNNFNGGWRTILDTTNYSSIIGNSFVKKTGDTMSGNLVVNAVSGLNGTATFNNPNGGESYIYLQSAGVNKGAFTTMQPTYGTCIFDSTSSGYLGIKTDGTPHFNGNTLWHAGNDGSGSGLDADLLDGHHVTSLESYQLVQINASGLDNNTWYPVTMVIGNSLRTRIRIEGFTNANASWNPRADKQMALYLDYVVTGSQWGWTSVSRNIYAYKEGAGTSSCLRGMGQLTNSSTEYIYVRGGAVYNFYVSRFIVPVLRTSTYTVHNQSVAPTTSMPAAIERDVALVTDNVASATQLQTARTINGTAFNGTSNIVTSYWGTARTLSLTGNATGSVSMNGSSNVSMSVNVNYATSAGNADTLDGVHNGSVTANHIYLAGGVSDFNTLTGNGIYNWINSAANRPADYGAVLQFSNVNNPVPGTDQHWITQLASATNNRLYYRKRTNTGNWASWYTIAFTTDNVASATKLQTARAIFGQSFDGTQDVEGQAYVYGSYSVAGSKYVNGGIQVREAGLVGAAQSDILYGPSIGFHWGGRIGSSITMDSTGSFRLYDQSYTGYRNLYTGSITASGNITAPSFYASNWFRSTGATGWYSETYGGGIFMSDSSWIRLYGGKSFSAGNGIIETDYLFDRQGYGGSSWNNGYGAYNVAIHNNNSQTPLLVAYRSGQSQAVTGVNRLFSMELLNNGGVMYLCFGGAMRYSLTRDGLFYASAGIYSRGYVSALGQNSSDARLKTNIQDFKATTLIKQLHPKSFEWNDLAKSKFEVFRNTGTQYGLIAQDVKEVMPEWVDDNLIGSGYMGIRYDKLIPIILQGEIETISRVETLEDKVKRLEIENSKLKAKLSKLERRIG